jgi:hypothetical protein
MNRMARAHDNRGAAYGRAADDDAAALGREISGAQKQGGKRCADDGCEQQALHEQASLAVI